MIWWMAGKRRCEWFEVGIMNGEIGSQFITVMKRTNKWCQGKNGLNLIFLYFSKKSKRFKNLKIVKKQKNFKSLKIVVQKSIFFQKLKNFSK